MAKKTVLVTGGAGFIGSHVNKMLLEAGYETVIFDNLSRGNAKAVIGGRFIKGDLADKQALEDLFTRFAFDAVMHFAAFTDVGESVKDPALYYGNNVVNSLNLLEAMRTHQAKTIIFSSSAAVYGSPQALKISEGHPSDPINPYGETKRIIEKALESYGYAYGLKSCSLRYFNAAGGDPEGKLKNYKAKENNLIPLALRAARDGGQLTVFGADYPTRDGTCIRDYVHVCDLGSAHIAAMEQLWAGAPTSIYNLGNGNGFSVHEVVKAVEAVTGSPLNVVEGERRPGDPAVLVADAARAQETLGWKPRYPSLETMIAHAWKAMNHG